MEFKTDQGRDAYREIVAETGRASQGLLTAARELAAKHPADSISIIMTASREVANMTVEGLARAIKVGVHIDAEWASLKAHVAMCSSR